MSMLQRVVRLPKKSFDLVKNATVIDKRKLYATWEHIQLTKLLAYLDVDCVFDIGASQGRGHAEPSAVVRVVDPDAVSYEFDNHGASFSVPMMLSRAQVFAKQDRDTSVEQS